MIRPRQNYKGEWRLETLEQEIHSCELSIRNMGEMIMILSQSNVENKAETIKLCGEEIKNRYEILKELTKEVKKLSTSTLE